MSLIRGGIIQSVKGLNRTKRWRKSEFALCLSWDIHLPLGIGTRSSDSGQDLRYQPILSLNCTTGFAHSPVCRQQIQNFLAFIIAWPNSYNKSQISIYYLSISHIGSISWRTLIHISNHRAAILLRVPHCPFGPVLTSRQKLWILIGLRVGFFSAPFRIEPTQQVGP